MDTFEYTCDYCGKKFKPRRRYVQRFCSTSCRVGSHNRKKKLTSQSENQNVPVETQKPEKYKITFPGIIESGIGALTADGVKSFLTKEENKPVTKGDLMVAKEQILQQIKTESLLTRLSQPKKVDDDFGTDWV